MTASAVLTDQARLITNQAKSFVIVASNDRQWHDQLQKPHEDRVYTMGAPETGGLTTCSVPPENLMAIYHYVETSEWNPETQD